MLLHVTLSCRETVCVDVRDEPDGSCSVVECVRPFLPGENFVVLNRYKKTFFLRGLGCVTFHGDSFALSGRHRPRPELFVKLWLRAASRRDVAGRLRVLGFSGWTSGRVRHYAGWLVRKGVLLPWRPGRPPTN
jgi:hypothetical protein